MKFTPKTDNEIAADGLFAAGVYDYEVVKAEDKVSKSSGNEMIALTLKLFDDGRSTLVNDYLLEKIAYKLKHICETTGLADAYARGDVEATDLEGRSGKVKIKIDDKNPDFPPKNAVVDYVGGEVAKREPAMARASSARAPEPPQGDYDDEIPF